MNNELHIFLSSTFDEKMLLIRKTFRTELEILYNGILNPFGINVYIRDLVFGIPKGYDPCKILEYNLSEVESCNSFFCFLSENYGTLVSNFLGEHKLNVNSRYFKHVDYALKNGLSVLELEMLVAESHKEIQKYYMYVEGEAVDARLMKYCKNDGYGGIVIMITELEDNDYRILQSSLKRVILMQLEEFEFPKLFGKKLSEIYQNPDDDLRSEYNKFKCSKLRYSVTNKKALAFVNEYIKIQTHSPLWIYGEGECGKTTLILQFIEQEAQKFDDYKIIQCFEYNASEFRYRMLNIIAELQTFTEIDIFKLFGSDFNEYDIIENFISYIGLPDFNLVKVIIIFDGLDHTIFAYEDTVKKLQLLDGKLPRNVKIIFTVNSIDTISNIIPQISYQMEAIPASQLFYKIFELEGKVLELPKVQELVDHYYDCKNLEFIYLLAKLIIQNSNFSNIEKLILEYSNFKFVNELYNEYFNRAEELYGKIDVTDFFCYILISKCITVTIIEEFIENTDYILLYFHDFVSTSKLDSGISFNSANIKKYIEYRYTDYLIKNRKIFLEKLVEKLWGNTIESYTNTLCVNEIVSYLIELKDFIRLTNYLSEEAVFMNLLLHDEECLSKALLFTNTDLVYSNWIRTIKENHMDCDSGHEVWDYFYKQGFMNECTELLEFWNGFRYISLDEKIKNIYQLSLLYEESEQYEMCRSLYYQALEILKEVKTREYLDVYANISFRLGRLLFESDDIRDNERCFDFLYEAADLTNELYGEASKEANVVFYTLGMALYSFGLLKQAYPNLKRAGYYLEQLYGLDNTYVQDIYKELLNISKKLLKFNDYYKWKNKLL